MHIHVGLSDTHELVGTNMLAADWYKHGKYDFTCQWDTRHEKKTWVFDSLQQSVA